MGNLSTHPTQLSFTIISNKHVAELLLERAEKKDMYLEECYDDNANALARKNMTYRANSISPEEVTQYRAVLQNALAHIPQRLRMDLNNIDIIPLMPSADSGMPHTRPDHLICIPNLTQLMSISTVIHELWHIHQRLYQSQWLVIFDKIGWKPWTGTIPLSMERYRRFNPDTIDSPFWIYQNQWIPVPIFNDISRPSVQDSVIWFYQPYETYHVTSVPPELKAQFPNAPPSAFEHPRELTAYVLSESDRYRSSPGFHILQGAVGYLSIV